MRIQLAVASLFCIAGVAAAWAAGVDLEHLAHLSAAAAIAAGAVAIAGAVAVVAGARRHRVALGVIWTAGFLGVGLAAFDNRAAAALVELPSRLQPSLTRECPPPSEQKPPPPPPPKRVAQAQGCALIIRAYELGYAKSLGSCAPKEVAETVEAAERPEPEPCRDRRGGEPLFHYAWRVLDRSLSGAGEVAASGLVSRAIDETRVRLDYLEPLARTQWHAIASSPRSSHHLFTNLPAPRQRGWLEPECVGRVHDLEARLGFDSPSHLVEHAHAMMLFDPRFGAPVGSCREHTIHWGQDPAICQRLRDSPEAALDDAGVLGEVEDALSRLRDASELSELSEKLGKRGADRLPAPTEIASVHCLIVGAGGEPGFSRDQVAVAGAAIDVLELRVGELAATGAAQLEVYQELSQVLAGARYDGPLESGAGAAAPLPAGLFDGDGFALARADALRDLDPFVDPANAAVIERDTIGEIYPLAIHLSQLIEVFRRRYRKQRRRL